LTLQLASVNLNWSHLASVDLSSLNLASIGLTLASFLV